MIFGIFSGHSPASISKSIDKIERQREAVKENLAQAVADRAAAMKELQLELTHLAQMKGRLS